MKEKGTVHYRTEISNFFFITLASLFGALGMHVFVYPSNFAPAGVDGIATMIQSLTGFNAGLAALLLNIPLFILAAYKLKKRYVVYTVYCLTLTSALLVLFEGISLWQYTPEGDGLISALFSGLLIGARTGILLKLGGSTGGTDIIACVIQRKRPYANVERIISTFCYVIVGASYFVYRDLNCILLSVVQLVVFEYVSRQILSPTRNAIEVKIITKNPREIRDQLLYKLKHGATIVESKGMYTEEGKAIIFSVINQRQIPEVITLMAQYPDTFVYYTDVKGVRGNFRWAKDDEAK